MEEGQILPKEYITQKVLTVGGNVIQKKFHCTQFLGKGSFSTCYLFCNEQTKKDFAIKVVDKVVGLSKPKSRQKLNTEIYIHKRLKHPNVVEFIDCFEDQQNVYIVLQLCRKKTLSQYLKARRRLTVKEVQKVLFGLCSSLIYIHSQQVIHRDLKLANIFLGDGYTIKVGDFGLSAKLSFNNDRKRSLCGTPNYLAPQVILGHGYSYEVDYWSVGIIVYTLFYGIPPFETQTISDTYSRIVTGSYVLQDSFSVPPQAKKLIKSLLQPQPCKRMTLEGVLDSDFMMLCQNGPGRFLQTMEPNAARSLSPSRDAKSKGRVLFTANFDQNQNAKSTSKPLRFNNFLTNAFTTASSTLKDTKKDKQSLTRPNSLNNSKIASHMEPNTQSTIMRLKVVRYEEVGEGVVYELSNGTIGYISNNANADSLIRIDRTDDSNRKGAVGETAVPYGFYLIKKNQNNGGKDKLRKIDFSSKAVQENTNPLIVTNAEKVQESHSAMEKCIRVFGLKESDVSKHSNCTSSIRYFHRSNSIDLLASQQTSVNMHYVKKVRKHLNMCMFRLSDQTIHWSFEDGIYISVDNKHFLVADNGQKGGYFEGTLEQFLKKDLPEFNNKKQYVKELFLRRKALK